MWHSDNVILYRWVIFTVSSTYSCKVTLASPFTNLDRNVCIYRNIPPNSCCVQTPKCQPCGVGTEKVSIWKPWMSLRIVRQSVRCFDISLLKWSWQKSSGFILGAPWISLLKFMAIPGMALEKKAFIETKCSTQSGARWKGDESPNVAGIIANHHIRTSKW